MPKYVNKSLSSQDNKSNLVFPIYGSHKNVHTYSNKVLAPNYLHLTPTFSKKACLLYSKYALSGGFP